MTTNTINPMIMASWRPLTIRRLTGCAGESQFNFQSRLPNTVWNKPLSSS